MAVAKTQSGPAFLVFETKGSMNHSLSEPIPGAPVLGAEGNEVLALLRLRESILAFAEFEGALKPHFVYGELSKADYEKAHVMHLNNHLQEFGWAA